MRFLSPGYVPSFKTFIAQHSFTVVENGTNITKYNQLHITFTGRNAHWMYDEMENISNTLDCSSECSPDDNYIIQGDFPVGSCVGTITNFSVPVVNNSATYNWSPSSNLQITAGLGTPNITVKAVGAGYSSIGLSIVTNCTTINVPIKNTGHVGGYGSSDYPVSGPSTACSNQTLYFHTNVLPGY